MVCGSEQQHFLPVNNISASYFYFLLFIYFFIIMPYVDPGAGELGNAILIVQGYIPKQDSQSLHGRIAVTARGGIIYTAILHTLGNTDCTLQYILNISVGR